MTKDFRFDDDLDPGGSGAQPRVSELFARVIEQSREIARAEADLVRAEAAERAAMLRRAAILGGLALVLALGAIYPLTQAAVYGLQALGLAPVYGALIAGVVLAVIAIVFGLIGISQIKRASAAPTKLRESLAKDAQTLKETLK